MCRIWKAMREEHTSNEIGPGTRTVAWMVSILRWPCLTPRRWCFPPSSRSLVIPAVMTLMMVKGRIIIGEDAGRQVF